MSSENYINLTTEISDGGAGNRARNVKAPNTRILLELGGTSYISYVPGLLQNCGSVLAAGAVWLCLALQWIHVERVLEIRALQFPVITAPAEIEQVAAALLAEGWTEI